MSAVGGYGWDPPWAVLAGSDLERIYSAVDVTTASDVLERWLRGCGVVPEQLREVVQRRIVEPLCSATSRYLLRDLGSSAVNDYGDLHREFHEIVLIDKKERSVLLTVLSDD